jgi:hypothetical protein
VADKSKITNRRFEIRSNSRINLILNENQTSLQKLYLENSKLIPGKKIRVVSFENVETLMTSYDITSHELRQHFYYSIMTIMDEDK